MDVSAMWACSLQDRHIFWASNLKMHSCHNGALKEEVLQIQHGGSVLHTGTHVPHKNAFIACYDVLTICYAMCDSYRDQTGSLIRNVKCISRI